MSPSHHMREVYICPNSSGHKADQLTDIQLFQVWSLHSSTFATIDYFFVCVCIDRIVQTAVKAYYFQSSLPLPCLRLKLHTYSNTQKIYLVSALCGTEHIIVLLWQLIRNSYIHEVYITCASLWQSHTLTRSLVDALDRVTLLLINM